MQYLRFLIVAVLLSSIFNTEALIQAEPLIIGNGFVHVAFPTGRGDAVWQLTAMDFFYEFGGDLTFVSQDLVISVGNDIDLSAHVVAPPGGLFLYQGSVYGGSGQQSNFIADLLTPGTNKLSEDGPFEYRVHMPFSIHGHLFGSLLDPTAPPTFLDLHVGGQGLATGSLQLQGDQLVLRQVEYSFMPVPEPSSAFLLLTGLLSVVPSLSLAHLRKSVVLPPNKPCCARNWIWAAMP